jgi:hypothetical protein
VCTEISTITALDRDRFVNLCTCGCLHIVWRQLTLRMHAADLAPARERLGSLAAPAVTGSVHVWLGTVGLHLRVAELRELVTLFARAEEAIADRALGSSGAAPGATARLVN